MPLLKLWPYDGCEWQEPKTQQLHELVQQEKDCLLDAQHRKTKRKCLAETQEPVKGKKPVDQQDEKNKKNIRRKEEEKRKESGGR
jgi:DNA replication initiation complex subunit (GINS family)